MQIIISILIIGLLWMIYDLINAPAVDENEEPVLEETAEENDNRPHVEAKKPAKEEKATKIDQE
jgi:hypothetical protein